MSELNSSTHFGKTARDVQVVFQPNKLVHRVTVPAGTECMLLDGGVNQHWVVKDIGFIEDKRGLLYHDAVYRGIPVSADEIVDIQENPDYRPAVSERPRC